MGLGWASDEETKFLQEFMPKYELCQVKRNYQGFWLTLFAAYQSKFPLIEKIWPNLGMTVESLTDTENEVYTKKLKARHDSLKEWFRWRSNPRSRNTTTAVTKKDLKTIYQPSRKRGHKSYEIFAKLYPETVDAIVEETCRVKGVTGKAKLPVWHKVVSGLWSKATREQVDAVNARIESEAGEKDHDSDDGGSNSGDSSPQTYQHYLKLLPGILSATVDPAVRKAGVMALCTIIGPVPEAGGQIIATTLQFGDSDGTPLFSSVWPGHEEAYVENLARFARKYEFPEELCMRRSLVVEDKGDLEGDETSSPVGSSQNEPTTSSAAGSPESNDPSKEPAHDPHSAQTGSLARTPSQTATATHGTSFGNPPPQPSQAGAPTPTTQQLAPVPPAAPRPPNPPPDSDIPVDSPTQNSIVSSTAASTTPQVPDEPIERPPSVSQHSVVQQGLLDHAPAGENGGHPGLPLPPQQESVGASGREWLLKPQVPPVPQSVTPFGSTPLTMSDPRYGPYSLTQDMLSFGDDFRFDPNMTNDQFEGLLDSWDVGTGRTWADALDASSGSTVDLSSFRTSDRRNWCDINTFNAIAGQGETRQPTFNLNFNGPPPQTVNTSDAPQTNQTCPVVQALYPPQTLVNPSMPHPLLDALHSTVTGAPQTVAAPSIHSITPSPSSVTSPPDPTGHNRIRPSETMTTAGAQPPVATKSTEADSAKPADTTFMLSMKEGFGSSLFGQPSAQPKEATAAAKRKRAKPVSLWKPSGPPANKENQQPVAQNQPTGTTTSPTHAPATLHPRVTLRPPPPVAAQLTPPATSQPPIPPPTLQAGPPATPQYSAPQHPAPQHTAPQDPAPQHTAPQHPSPPLPPPLTDSSTSPHIPAPTLPDDSSTSQDSTTRRSARGTIKSTWLERQNLIGTNTVSHPANIATTTRTEDAEDEGPPPWFTDAVNHFQSYDLGDGWKLVLQRWMALEASLGHGNVAKTPLPVQNRPDEWTKWASKTKHGLRPYDKNPEISDPAEFGLALLKWWYTLQPSFRASDNSFPRPVFSDPAYVGDPWTTIRKSGPNGFVVFLTLLAWWGRGLSTPSPFKEDSRPAWNLLLRDVRLCLEEMSRTLPQVGEKRRRGQGDDGVQDNKRQKRG